MKGMKSSFSNLHVNTPPSVVSSDSALPCLESRCHAVGPYAHICRLTTQTGPVAATSGAAELIAASAPIAPAERADRSMNARLIW